MKHNIPIAVAALAVVFAGCNARSSAERSANAVTVSGCVQSAEQGLGSKDKNDIDKFILTNANLSSAAAPARSERTASDKAPNDAAAPVAPAAASTGNFMLDGKTSELREHLNQQVEITGRVDRDTDRDKNAKDVNASSQAPKLNVDSIRTVAANCSR